MKYKVKQKHNPGSCSTCEVWEEHSGEYMGVPYLTEKLVFEGSLMDCKEFIIANKIGQS